MNNTSRVVTYTTPTVISSIPLYCIGTNISHNIQFIGSSSSRLRGTVNKLCHPCQKPFWLPLLFDLASLRRGGTKKTKKFGENSQSGLTNLLISDFWKTADPSWFFCLCVCVSDCVCVSVRVCLCHFI